jgi:uncharacterized OB-fold protein
MTERVPEAPEPTVETQGYWAAARDGRLMIGHCRSCSTVHFYPRGRCPHCLGADTDLVEVSGRGTVYSYSVMRRAKVPYAIAYVSLEEGVTMMSNIVACDFDSIQVGMPVQVTFRPAENGAMVPMFAPR